jgi:hypothetical protein
LFRWAHGPWLWNEITEEWFFVNNPPAEWQCYFFRNKQGCHVHWWLSGKRWFLEPVSSEWSHFYAIALIVEKVHGSSFSRMMVLGCGIK